MTVKKEETFEDKTTEPTLETQRDEAAPLPKWGEWVMANFATKDNIETF